MKTKRDDFEEYERLQAEIQREKAEALGRAGERLEEALRKLAELRNTIEALGEELKGASCRGILILERSLERLRTASGVEKVT